MGKRLLNRYTDNDIRFLVETVNPALVNRINTIKNDPEIIESMLDDQSGKLFQRVMLESL